MMGAPQIRATFILAGPPSAYIPACFASANAAEICGAITTPVTTPPLLPAHWPSPCKWPRSCHRSPALALSILLCAVPVVYRQNPRLLTTALSASHRSMAVSIS